MLGTAGDAPPSFAGGFRAILPLWLGMIPFGLAYAVTARSAGLSILETQLMSLLVFSGGAQFSAAGLFAAGATGASIILTTFLVNARHLLYGLSLGQRLRLTWPERLVAAHFLTDEAFGVTVSRGRRNPAFLLGAELSVFAVWNTSTLAGSLMSEAVPDPVAIGIDFIFPLAFLALLVPLLKRWLELAIAVTAGFVALVAAELVGSGVAILIAGVLGALLGAWWTRGEGAEAPPELKVLE
ncbi:MAG: AzlC family ABC transporter permease [Deinococcota bacterium]|nr:AzlC family ABC transporter permease [Deinococcota bacterium]